MMTSIQRILLAIFVVVGLSISAKAQTNFNTKIFKRVVDSVYGQHPEMLGVLVHIEAPDQHISWSYAVGKDGKNTDKAVNAEQPVLISSTTKSYIAAAILRLMEMGQLSIREPIKHLITLQSATALSGAGYNLDSITIRHLLSHTSGIRDYVDQDYFDFIDKNKQHRWTREEQVERAAGLGGPLGRPGSVFEYADVNFVLLSEVIEHFTKEPFYRSVRRLLNYKKNRLNNTWFVQLEKRPEQDQPLVNQHWNMFSWNIKDLNPSWDLYGSGGIASTVSDMARFYQQLFTGKIIEHKNILQLMITDVPPDLKTNYCLGVRKIKAGAEMGYNHGGGLGTDLTYFPGLNATIALASVEAGKRDIALQIRDLLVSRLERLTQ